MFPEIVSHIFQKELVSQKTGENVLQYFSYKCFIDEPMKGSCNTGKRFKATSSIEQGCMTGVMCSYIKIRWCACIFLLTQNNRKVHNSAQIQQFPLPLPLIVWILS